MDKNKGAAGTLTGKNGSGGFMLRPPEDDTPTLDDMGISKSQSSRWQAEASVPEEQFEVYVVETKANGEELTSVPVAATLPPTLPRPPSDPSTH